MLFDDVTCSIISKDNSVIASGHKRGNLYVLDGTADRRPDEALVAAQPTSDLWHQRLAHINDKVLATYFMAHKSDTLAMFQEFHVKVT